MSARRALFAAGPALGVGLVGLGLGEWSQRQAEARDDIAIPWDEPAIKYEFAPGGNQNSHGFNERELPLEKPPGTLRIAGLGDSVTHGAFVSSAEAWPRQLEGLLNAEGYTVEALNFGVYGYDTESVAAQLRARVLAWHPDVVVYGFYVNDPMPTEMVTADDRPVYVGTGPRDFQVFSPGVDAWLHRGSALFRRFEGAAAARAIVARGRHDMMEWERFGGWLDTLVATAKDAGLPLITLAIPPHVMVHSDLAMCEAAAQMGPRFCVESLEDYDKAMGIMQARGMAPIDGLAAYRAPGETDLHGRPTDPHHPSAEGHRRLAVALEPLVAAQLRAIGEGK